MVLCCDAAYNNSVGMYVTYRCNLWNNVAHGDTAFDILSITRVVARGNEETFPLFGTDKSSSQTRENIASDMRRYICAEFSWLNMNCRAVELGRRVKRAVWGRRNFPIKLIKAVIINLGSIRLGSSTSDLAYELEWLTGATFVNEYYYALVSNILYDMGRGSVINHIVSAGR